MIFTPEQIAAAKLDVIACLGQRVVIDIAHVGSTYISGEGSDLDLVVYIRAQVIRQSDAVFELYEWGYIKTGHGSGEDDEFTTLRKGDVNLMVTSDRDFMVGFEQAAEVCKYVTQELAPFFPHGVLTKAQRIKIHRILMNGEEA